MAKAKKPATRLVSVDMEYMDGIEMATIREPNEHMETVRAIPVELIEEHQAAWAEVYAVEKRLMEAWGRATELPNKKYVAPDTTEAFE